MGGEGDLLSRVRRMAALLDDDALAALANRGLVRRARKDAERDPPQVVGEEDGRVRVDVEGCTVHVAERPAESRCSCPAGGVCRHVLAALVHLAREASGGPGAAAAGAPEGSCGEEVLDIGDDDLRRWAGGAALKRALAEVGGGLEVAFEDGAPLLARLPGWNAECRFYPGGGLEGMICSCHAAGPCPHKLAAVIAWQARSGRRALSREEVLLSEAEGAPRTREEVRASAQRTIGEAIALGLSRLSPAAEGRLRTLATSAHGVDLPRLAGLLRGVADEIAAWLGREARASSEGLLARAAQAVALADALAAPTPALVGRHRSRYERVGELELVGLGARAWRSASGYAGLTVYFWDRPAARWATWTEARPVATAPFDPAGRFTAPGPWTGCSSPAQAAASRIRLMGAFRSGAGRLSGREATRMIAMGPSEPDSVPAVARWSDLVPRAWSAFGAGLGDRDEQAEVVLLRPTGWGSVAFDPIRQELVAEVLDAEGRTLPLVLPHAERSRGIDILEAAAARPPPAVLVALRISRGRLAAEPVSLLEPGQVTSLGLADAAPRASPAESPAATGQDEPGDEDEDDPEDEDGEIAVPGGAPGQLLLGAWAELERLAEGGSAAYRGFATLGSLAGRAEGMGLATVASALRRLAEAGLAPSDDASGRLHRIAHLALRAAYLVRASEVTLAVESATASYA